MTKEDFETIESGDLVEFDGRILMMVLYKNKKNSTLRVCSFDGMVITSLRFKRLNIPEL